jgi:hypothetical protein
MSFEKKNSLRYIVIIIMIYLHLVYPFFVAILKKEIPISV